MTQPSISPGWCSWRGACFHGVPTAGCPAMAGGSVLCRRSTAMAVPRIAPATAPRRSTASPRTTAPASATQGGELRASGAKPIGKNKRKHLRALSRQSGSGDDTDASWHQCMHSANDPALMGGCAQLIWASYRRASLLERIRSLLALHVFSVLFSGHRSATVCSLPCSVCVHPGRVEVWRQRAATAFSLRNSWPSRCMATTQTQVGIHACTARMTPL